jgi:hypothetical protein
MIDTKPPAPGRSPASGTPRLEHRLWATPAALAYWRGSRSRGSHPSAFSPWSHAAETRHYRPRRCGLPAAQRRRGRHQPVRLLRNSGSDGRRRGPGVVPGAGGHLLGHARARTTPVVRAGPSSSYRARRTRGWCGSTSRRRMPRRSATGSASSPRPTTRACRPSGRRPRSGEGGGRCTSARPQLPWATRSRPGSPRAWAPPVQGSLSGACASRRTAAQTSGRTGGAASAGPGRRRRPGSTFSVRARRPTTSRCSSGPGDAMGETLAPVSDGVRTDQVGVWRTAPST